MAINALFPFRLNRDGMMLLRTLKYCSTGASTRCIFRVCKLKLAIIKDEHQLIVKVLLINSGTWDYHVSILLKNTVQYDSSSLCENSVHDFPTVLVHKEKSSTCWHSAHQGR